MKKKFLSVFLVFILLIVCFAAVGCAGGDGGSSSEEDLYNYPELPPEPPVITQKEYEYAINSFDELDKLLSFNYRDVNGKVRLGYDEALSRQYSTFEIYGNPSKGSNAWPSIGMYETDGNISISDWEGFASIVMDVKNETDRPVTLNYKLFDKNYNFIEKAFNLPANSEWTECRKVFDPSEKPEFDYSEIVLMEFWVFNITGNQTPIVLSFDDLRLDK